jgi:hypothetical protein
VADSTLLLLIAHNFRLKGLSPLIDTARPGPRNCRFSHLVVGQDNPVGYQRPYQRPQARSPHHSRPTQRVSHLFLP